jgi:very-short-patch-repair endonuclease
MLLLLIASLGGVTSMRALTDRGVSVREVAAAVRRGDVIRPRQGWVALPSADRAAIAAVRVGGTLSCTSLLRRHRVWTTPVFHLHLRVPRNASRLASPADRRRRLSNTDAVITHHVSWLPPAVAAVDTLAHAVALAVVCQPRLDAIATLDAAVDRELFTIAELHDVLAPAPQKYRDMLAHVRVGAQSGLETKGRLLLRSRRIRVRSQVAIAGVGHVDLVVGERLVIELDGYEWHSRRADFEEDRRRDLVLAQRGYQVLRLSYAQVTGQWPWCEEVILGLVRARKHLWPRSGA